LQKDIAVRCTSEERKKMPTTYKMNTRRLVCSDAGSNAAGLVTHWSCHPGYLHGISCCSASVQLLQHRAVEITVITQPRPCQAC